MCKKIYSEEFKKGAVEQVLVQRHTISSVAKRLGVNYHTLREWVQTARSAATTSLVPADLPAEQRIRELEKELARVRMERDISKKSDSILRKGATVKFSFSKPQPLPCSPPVSSSKINRCRYNPKLSFDLAHEMQAANAAARAERLRAARTGAPYSGQAGHVPDTAISGNPVPPAGWLDMPGKSNGVAGGGLGSRIGQTIDQVTVDGKTP